MRTLTGSPPRPRVFVLYSASRAHAPLPARARAGHINHSIYWKNLTPPGSYAAPSGDLLKLIDAEASVGVQRPAVHKRGRKWSHSLSPKRRPSFPDPPLFPLFLLFSRPWQWGSLDKLVAALSALSVGVQGSGWGVRLPDPVRVWALRLSPPV